MCTITYWPPDSKSVTQRVKTEESFKTDWPKYDVEVKRFYNTYQKARAALSGFLIDSNYETEVEQNMGCRKRKKKVRQISSSGSDSSSANIIPLKIAKISIPAPPAVTFETKTCDADLNLTSSIQLNRDVSASTSTKLAEEEKLQEKKLTKRKKSSYMNLTELKETIQKAKETASKIKRLPKSSTLLNITVKSPLKSMSSSVSLVSASSNSFVGSLANNDEKTVQEDMISPSKQSLIQNKKLADNSLDLDDSILIRTQDFILTDNISRTSSENIVQCNSSRSKRNDSKLSTSCRRKLFKEHLHNKNMEETLIQMETKLHRTFVTMGEISGKMDILIMNMSKIMRFLVPSEKRISRPEKMPALPLDTKQHLKEFEKFLEADPNLSAACHYMSNYMKQNVNNPERKSATNMLSKLLSNTLASEMNCEGGNKKIGFKSLKLYDLFLGTLQIAFPESDLVEADAALAGWLKNAKWRKKSDGGQTGKQDEKILITVQ